MRFVDMWVLDRIDFSYVPIELLLFELHDLREQWNSQCSGITPKRVVDSVLHMHTCGEIALYRRNKNEFVDHTLEQVVATRDDIEVLRKGTLEDVRISGLVVARTPLGYAVWYQWKDYDWNNYSTFEFEPEDTNNLVRPGSIEIFAATWHRLLYEIRHAPDLHAAMVVPFPAKCEVTAQWAINTMVSLPWCFHFRSKGQLLYASSDFELIANEKATESLCMKLESAVLQWDLKGRKEIPFRAH
jgi:hypothetical protein